MSICIFCYVAIQYYSSAEMQSVYSTAPADWVIVLARISSVNQTELFDHLTVSEQISSGSFKDVLYKLIVYKSYI